MSRKAAAVVLYTGEDAAAVPPTDASTGMGGSIAIGKAFGGAATTVRGLADAGRERAAMLKLKRRSTLERQLDSARELAQQGSERVAQLRLGDRLSSGLDAARDFAQQGADRIAELNLAERLEVARGAASEGAGRLARSNLVERLPDQVRTPVQQRLGARRRSRWWTVAWVTAAVLAGTVAALVVVKKVFAPDYDELSLYDEDEPRPLGEPVAYPAAGSGTGWPEPQRTPESTEMLTARANGAASTAGGRTGDESTWAREPEPGTESSGTASGISTSPSLEHSTASTTEPASMGGGTVPVTGNEPAPSVRSPLHEGADPRAASTDAYREAVASEGSVSQQSGVEHAVRPAAGVVGPSMPAGPAGPDGPGVGAPAAPPSETAKRPPVPFTEEQAEMNARLQLHQDELLAAFPQMSRGDIVASDGDLDRLAELIQPGAGMPLDAVRARLDQILLTSADAATNPVLPES